MQVLHAITKLFAILGVVFGLVLGPIAILEYTLSADSQPVDLSEEHRDELPVETPHPTPAFDESSVEHHACTETVHGSQTGLGPRNGHIPDLLRPPNA